LREVRMQDTPFQPFRSHSQSSYHESRIHVKVLLPVSA
jgi:hypothetical protein